MKKYCDSTCKKCIYSTTLSNWPRACAYILTTGSRRGCPPGEGCIRRVEGQKQPTIDSIVFHGNDKNKTTPQDRRKAKDREYNKEYYLAHREEIIARQKARQAEKRERTPRKKKEPTSWTEAKRILAERTHAYWQGRQTAVIRAYLDENGISTTTLAVMVGVSESAVRRWAREANNADWEKLAQVGIKKPEIE